MKALAVLLLVGLLAPAAFAGLDPATDSFGVYFDTDGNTNCTTAAPFELVTAYLTLMNPAGPTNGFECSVSVAGVPHVVLSTVIEAGPGCHVDKDVSSGDFAVACGSNFAAPPSGAMILVAWTLLLQEPGELLFHVGPHPIPSLPGGLPVVVGDGVLRLCNVASGDPGLPVAGINAANCPVSDEASSFGRVKSLFR
ncbi:MAG: hypothetical protein IPK64_10450 [bacterium]|nr:hypothetical protein [bacterium]